ncbi:prepilin-type N-terminal cleavage/methylation domain-containing protein [Pseudoalteromonas xiamenensis]
MRKYDGFTLIELLIVTSLLSMLMLGGFYTYSIFSTRWNKEVKQYSQSKESMQGLYHFNDLMSTIKPYIIKSDGTLGFLFIGREDSILGVRNNSFFSTNESEVFRLTFQKAADGKYSLIYQSAPLEHNIILTSEDKIQFKYRYVVLTGIDSHHISYFGYSGFSEKNDSSEKGTKPKWSERFSGLDRLLMPEKINIELVIHNNKSNFFFSLDQKAERHVSYYMESDT